MSKSTSNTQVAERQLPEPSHASFLQLNINTRFSKCNISQKVSFANPSDCSDGLESLNVVFDTGEKKAEWEEAFSKAKEKLEASATQFMSVWNKIKFIIALLFNQL